MDRNRIPLVVAGASFGVGGTESEEGGAHGRRMRRKTFECAWTTSSADCQGIRFGDRTPFKQRSPTWHINMAHGTWCFVSRSSACRSCESLGKNCLDTPASTTAMEPRLHSRPFSKFKVASSPGLLFQLFLVWHGGFPLKDTGSFHCYLLTIPPNVLHSFL